MQLSVIHRAATAALIIAACLGSAQAADFSFSGQAVLNTDVARVQFDIDANPGAVRLWTDSWQSGLNFDPTMALWRQQGNDYALVLQNDDDDSVGAGQGFFDSGLALASLASGHYLLTVGASPYFAAGTLLSQGFGFDPAYGAIAVQPIAQWNQPSYDPNANDQKGGFWRVNLAGVQNAALVSSVPEPTSLALWAAGLALLGAVRRRYS